MMEFKAYFSIKIYKIEINILLDKNAICVDEPPRRIKPSVSFDGLKLSSK